MFNTLLASRRSTLADLPLWRLIVLLADTERECGADSDTARLLARLLQERLQQEQAVEQETSRAFS